MWAAIKTFFTGIWGTALEWLGIVAGISAIFLEVFNAGKKSEKLDEVKTVGKEVDEAHAIQDANKTRPDGAALDELRTDWSR